MPGAKQILQGLLLLPHAVRNNTGTPGGGRGRLWLGRRYTLFLHVAKTGKCEDALHCIFHTNIQYETEYNSIFFSFF